MILFVLLPSILSAETSDAEKINPILNILLLDILEENNDEPTFPRMTSPASGERLNGATPTFHWESGDTTISRYYLEMGSTLDGDDFISKTLNINTTNYTPSGEPGDRIPTDGSTIYGKLYYGMSWEYIRFQFIAVLQAPDETPPTITITGDNPVNIPQNTYYYSDAGATALDDRDGAVTVRYTGNVNTSNLGSYTVTFTARDAAGNVATATRIINVVNAPDINVTAPVITITGENPVNIIIGTYYTDAGATAVDDRDGSVTVTTNSTLNNYLAGSYSITYTAQDAAGNKSTATRTVNVLAPDVTAPVITITGDDPVNIIKNSNYTDAGATAIDDRDGTVSVTVSKYSTVNTDTIGTYTITYYAEDKAGNRSTARRKVNVIHELPTEPVLSSGGEKTYMIQLEWQDVSNETSYKIYRNGTLLEEIEGDNTEYLDSGLTPLTSYNYQIEAINSTGSKSSNTLSLRTKRKPIASDLIKVVTPEPSNVEPLYKLTEKAGGINNTVMVTEMDVTRMKNTPATNVSPYWYEYYRKFWNSQGNYQPSNNNTQYDCNDSSSERVIAISRGFYDDRQCASTPHTLWSPGLSTDPFCRPIELIHHFRNDFDGWIPGNSSLGPNYYKNNQAISMNFGILLKRKFMAGKNRDGCEETPYWIHVLPGEVQEDGWAIVPKSKNINDGWVFIVPKDSDVGVSTCKPDVIGCDTKAGTKNYIYNPAINFSKQGCNYINKSLCAKEALKEVTPLISEIKEERIEYVVDMANTLGSLHYNQSDIEEIREELSRDDIEVLINASNDESYVKENIVNILTIAERLEQTRFAQAEHKILHDKEAAFERYMQGIMEGSKRRVARATRTAKEDERKMAEKLIVPLITYLKTATNPFFRAWDESSESILIPSDAPDLLKKGKKLMKVIEVGEIAIRTSINHTENKALFNKTYISMREAMQEHVGIDLDSEYGFSKDGSLFKDIYLNFTANHKKFNKWAELTVQLYDGETYTPQEAVRLAFDSTFK